MRLFARVGIGVSRLDVFRRVPLVLLGGSVDRRVDRRLRRLGFDGLAVFRL